jgi:hypothetical protein
MFPKNSVKIVKVTDSQEETKTKLPLQEYYQIVSTSNNQAIQEQKVKKCSLETKGSTSERSDAMLDNCQESPIQNKSQYSMQQSLTSMSIRQEESQCLKLITKELQHKIGN